MTLDYKWAIGQMKKGLSAEGIEETARRELRAKDFTSLKEKIYQTVLNKCALWHDTRYLSDQDVIKAFTEVGKEIVEEQKHRKGKHNYDERPISL
jgi:hypothetical protein